ncbi:MAG TPA: hypothetical protein VIJ01_00960 [Candidatus Angelobacter sp.]
MKIEVKKKIDVIFDCRTAQRSSESHFRVKTQSQIGKKISEQCENALMLAALSDIRTISTRAIAGEKENQRDGKDDERVPW